MPYTKGRLLIDGGEGYIYEVAEDPGLLMKIYKETDSLGEAVVTPELIKKLRFMVDNPPTVLIEKNIIAWPVEVVYEDVENEDSPLNIIGFVMPKLDMDEHLQRVYSYRHPQLDSAEYAKFPSVHSRISIAINLCSALHELHRVGYVVGDFNHRNIGVNYNTGQIYFVDCDSFHITDYEGNVYRSNVIMAGYLAPEIISHCNAERSENRYYNLDKVAPPTFTKQSDLFCLAIHIFKLLMNGVDPFRGIKSDAMGSTASPFVGNDAIERDAYVFKPGNKPSAVFCPPVESVPPELFTLFDKAFIHGRADPGARPDAGKWYHALTRFLTSDLTQCPKDAKHHYYKQLTQCPYCTADYMHLQAQGVDYAHSLPARPVNLAPDIGVPYQTSQGAASNYSRQPAYNQQPGYGQQAGYGQQTPYSRQSAGSFAGYGQTAYAHTAKKSKTGAIAAIIISCVLVSAALLYLFVFGGLSGGSGAVANTPSGTYIAHRLMFGDHKELTFDGDRFVAVSHSRITGEGSFTLNDNEITLNFDNGEIYSGIFDYVADEIFIYFEEYDEIFEYYKMTEQGLLSDPDRSPEATSSPDPSYTASSPGTADPLPPETPAETPPSNEVRSVSIMHENTAIHELTINVGETVRLSAIIEPLGVETQLSWVSSDASVFDVTPVSATGATADIRAVGAGSAELIVTAGDVNQICIVRVRLPQPSQEPEQPLSYTLPEAIQNTNNWTIIRIYWTDRSGTTVFERDKDSEVWLMMSRDGYWRILEPTFTYSSDVINIGFPTSRTEYYLYDDMTGHFGSDMFTWEFETDPNYTRNSISGVNQTQGLQSALAQYPVIAIRMYWRNGETTILYLHDNGGWSMVNRNGSFNTSVSPNISYQSNNVIISFGSTSNQYTIYNGGTGMFGNESFTWEYFFSN